MIPPSRRMGAGHGSAVRRSRCTCATSCSIGEPLAHDAGQRLVGACLVVHIQPDAGVVSEVKLGDIAVKTPLAAMLVDAFHPALEHGIEAFDGIGMDDAVPIFSVAVTDEIMLSEVLPEMDILASFVGHDAGSGQHMDFDDRQQIGCFGAVHVERTGLPTTFNQSHDRVFVGIAALDGHAFLLADEGLVNLDNGTGAAHGIDIAAGHGFADAMAQEPCGFEAAAKGPVKLAGADTLRAAAHEVDRLQPNPQRLMAGLENGSHADGKGFTAGFGFVDPSHEQGGPA